jgi:hypothetical protein
MATKTDLLEWVLAALREPDGQAHVTAIARHSWGYHESDLRSSGDLFFTWQYDMRRAAQRPQKAGKLVKLSRSWRLTV